MYLLQHNSSTDSSALLTKTNVFTPKPKYFSQKINAFLTQANKITSETNYSYYNQYISPGMYVTLLKPTWSH